MAQSADFTLDNFRGGMNDQDPSHSISDDQVTVADNVEFFFSTLGERRRGMQTVSITSSHLDDDTIVVHLGTHLPAASDLSETELWGVSATPGVSTTIAHRNSSGVWAELTPSDAISAAAPYIYQIQSQSAHGKMYVAYKSSVDRLHVFDGTSLRRTGLAAPVLAPTTANTANPGTFAGNRTYRVRFITQSAGVTVRQSEPSPEVIASPSGVNDGIIVTRPAAVSEGETHWELEASDGDGNFYRIATTILATTTFTDTIQSPADYAILGTLSADIGDYTLIPSVRFIKQDQDRMIFAGSFEDPDLGSRISWTPVLNATGFNNDERIPVDTDNFLDLGSHDAAAGDITGLSDPLNGSFYAFKWTKVYKIQRTGQVDGAYEAFQLSDTKGAIPGSIVSGMDEFGRGCIYFLDPAAGPTRISTGGLQQIQGIRTTWRTVNTSSEKVVTHGVYYPDKQQVHWWVATDDAVSPNLKMILQVNEVRSNGLNGAQRGWSRADGSVAMAWCSTVLPEVITDEDTETASLSYHPYMGFQTPRYLQRGDVGDTDDNDSYYATIRTKPYIRAGLLNKWGSISAILLAAPDDSGDTMIEVSLIRDFGLEESEPIQVNFIPVGVEELVLKQIDDLRMVDARVLQVNFSDTGSTPTGRWQLHRFDMKMSGGERS